MKRKLYNKLSGIILLGLSLLLICFGQKARADIYFPHVACNAPWGTEICIINSSGDSTTGTLKSFTDDGTLVDSIPITLDAHQRRQINVGAEMSNSGRIGYIIFDTKATSLIGYTKFYRANLYRVAVPAITSSGGSEIIIPHIASDSVWWTGLSLVNTSTAGKQLLITFNTGETRQVSLKGGEHRAFSIASLFGTASKPALKSGVISNADGVIGLELFGNSYQLSGVILQGEKEKNITVSHVTTDNAWWTGVVAYNSSATTAQLTVQPYNSAGVALSVKHAEVKPGQQYIGTPAILGLPANTTWFNITSSTDISSFELFGTNNGRQLAGYSLLDIRHKSGIFAKIEDQGWTGIALVNPNNTAAQVTLTAYNNYGLKIADRKFSLPAHNKQLGTPEVLFNNQNLGGATYIQFTSDQNLAGFQLNGDNSGMLLDALPALPALPTGSASGNNLPAKLKNNVDTAMSLVGYNDDLQTTVGEAVTLIFVGLLGNPSTLTCPHITRNPQNFDINNLPSTITIAMDFGEGCKMSGDNATISGLVNIIINNLMISDSEISTDFEITGANLAKNGVSLLNGTINGNVVMSEGDGGLNLNLTADFGDLQTLNSTLNGQLAASINNLNLDDGSFTNADFTFKNFTNGTYVINSGSMNVSTTNNRVYLATADLSTNDGPIAINLSVERQGDKIIVNTTQTGTLSSYNTTINNVTLDPAICPDYPSSGSINLVNGAESYTITFTDACDGSYTVSQP